MKICPQCGEEVRDMDVIFHKCGPSIEIGKPKEDQEFKFVDFLTEWWVYCIFTPSFSGSKWSKFDEQHKFSFFKWLLYNTTTIMIPCWLLTLSMNEFITDQLGKEMGLVVLISPPYLIYFVWKFKLKGRDTFAILFLIGQILIIFYYVLIFLTLIYWSY